VVPAWGEKHCGGALSPGAAPRRKKADLSVVQSPKENPIDLIHPGKNGNAVLCMEMVHKLGEIGGTRTLPEEKGFDMKEQLEKRTLRHVDAE